MQNKLKIGVIADDFTGGSDAASFLSLGGMSTILTNGIPLEEFCVPEGCEAVVIALKTRTEEKETAVSESLKAAQWLKEQGTEHFYFKYCSTFDSTDNGNIGPVTDALMEYLDVRKTILCPALPANGRTVRNGILYVNGIRLEDSSMRHHPLTPMRKSRIKELMSPQGKYTSLEINKNTLYMGTKAVKDRINSFAETNEHFYIVPDYETEEDAEKIISLFGSFKLLTGGSGILKSFAERTGHDQTGRKQFPKKSGKAVLVAGSCSAATRAQELCFEASGGKSIRLSDQEVAEGTVTPEALFTTAKAENGPVLVYSYDSPEGLAKKRNEYGRMLAGKVEETLSSFARYAYDHGVKTIIAAGGETSGAVTQALGWQSFWIGESIAPGVPILIPVDNKEIRLVLKSGNFGQEDFFMKALEMTGGI